MGCMCVGQYASVYNHLCVSRVIWDQKDHKGKQERKE